MKIEEKMKKVYVIDEEEFETLEKASEALLREKILAILGSDPQACDTFYSPSIGYYILKDVADEITRLHERLLEVMLQHRERIAEGSNAE